MRWTSEEVKIWFKATRVGSDLWSDYLKPQRLNGESLRFIDIKTLQSFGISFGEAVTLMERIDKLKMRAGEISGGGVGAYEEKERRRYSNYVGGAADTGGEW